MLKSCEKIFWAFFLTVCFIAPAQANWLDAIWGTAPKDGIFYLPYGIHTNKVTDIKSFQLMGGTYKSAFAMTFINSFYDRVWSIGVERNVYQYKRLGLGYGAGLIYGYKGQLADVSGVPLSHTFLFEGNLNPVLALVAHVDLAKHLQFKLVVEPLVIVAGLKVTF